MGCLLPFVAVTRDRARDLEIFSLALSQLSYHGLYFFTKLYTNKEFFYSAQMKLIVTVI